MADEPEKGKETVSYDGRILLHLSIDRWRTVLDMHIYNDNVSGAVKAYERYLWLVISFFVGKGEEESCLDGLRKIWKHSNLLTKFPSNKRESEQMRTQINAEIMQDLKMEYLSTNKLMKKYKLTLGTFIEEEKGWDKTLDKLKKQFQNYE